jgi:hypothetical protein
MSTSPILSVTAFTAISLARVATAGDLLDAPGPGYFQQIEHLSPRRTPNAEPEIIFGRAVQIYVAPTAVFPGWLPDTEHAFSRPIQLFQQSRDVIKTGQGVLRILPPPKKPH